MSGEKSANLYACLHSPLTGPEDGPERGIRRGGRWKQGGDLSKVYPAAPPLLPPRESVRALMRDPVELLGRRLKERWDVETGQARGKSVCLCVSGFCVRYLNSFWKVTAPWETQWRMFLNLILS